MRRRKSVFLGYTVLSAKDEVYPISNFGRTRREVILRALRQLRMTPSPSSDLVMKLWRAVSRKYGFRCMRVYARERVHNIYS
jgi:hypothetical protein